MAYFHLIPETLVARCHSQREHFVLWIRPVENFVENFVSFVENVAKHKAVWAVFKQRSSYHSPLSTTN